MSVEHRRADGSWTELGGPTATDPDGILRRPGLGPGTYRLRWDRPRRPPAYSLPTRARQWLRGGGPGAARVT
ncbi:MAG: hypothetical protein M3350_06790 [Actinomycetota bacterium]|nr:hypothetical protein [Actinomycetota bacterium]